MKRLLWILFVVFITSCASAPVGSGYLQGVLDTETMCISPTDTPGEKRVKKIAAKVIVAAQSEIKTLDKKVKKAGKELKHWKNIISVLVGIFVCTIIFLLIADSVKKPRR